MVGKRIIEYLIDYYSYHSIPKQSYEKIRSKIYEIWATINIRLKLKVRFHLPDDQEFASHLFSVRKIHMNFPD